MISNSTLIPLQLNGSLTRGGWLGTNNVANDTDAVSRGLNIRSLGKSLNKADMLWTEYFNAHVLSDPAYNFSRFNSNARFQVGTADAFFRGKRNHCISFAAVSSPDNSYEATSWNFGEIITHIVERHSNFIYDADGSNGSPEGFIFSTDIDIINSIDIELFIVRDSNNMWSTLQKIAAGEFYSIYFTRANKLVYKPLPMFISPQATAKGTLTKEHIKGPVRVSFPSGAAGQPGAIGQVDLMSFKNSTTIYKSTYPSTPVDGKIFKKHRGIWASSQANSDTIAERLYRWMTRNYTLSVNVPAGLVLYSDDGAGLELGDRVLVTYSGPSEDSSTGHGVHLNLSAQSMFVYGVDVKFSGAHEATATLTLEHDNS